MYSKILRVNWVACFLLLAWSSCTNSGHYREALSPEEALSKFKLADGFAMEVFASEPHITDPVEMVFDEQGNIYLVEMGDYPYKPEPGEGKGKIRLLKDTDGDGVIDESVIFAEGLPDATSILPWDGGVIVTSAPDILYLKDTTGDGRADIKEVLFTGFFENNSEAQITSLRYGVDNWIYANNNGQRGEVKFNRRPELPALAVGGGDFRFRLDKNLFEVESGLGQYGLTMDDWGNRFFTQNTLHIQTAPIPWRYLYRHDYLPSYSGVSNIYAHDLTVYQISESPHWRVERSTRRQQQYDEAGLDRVEHIEGHFTGASGGTLYAADLFPASFYGNVFTAEVACNLVHRDVIEYIDEAPFLLARRDSTELDREFLASSDPWFRPVNFTVGPEGALYVVDMYRQHIETPVSIPDDLKEDMDFVKGNQYGRIYRVFPDRVERPNLVRPQLREKATEELVKLLEEGGQWWRLNAQRLIIERQDKSVSPILEKLYHEHADPRTRLHALYALEGLDGLNAAIIRKALADSDTQVRRHAIILSERYPETIEVLAQLVDDEVPLIAFQAALSVGQFSNAKAVAALAKIVQQYHKDEWFNKAVLSSNIGSSPNMLNHLSASGFFDAPDTDKLKFVNDLSFVVGARAELGGALTLIDFISHTALKDKVAFQRAVVSGFTKGAEQAEWSKPDREAIGDALKKQRGMATAELSNSIDEALSLLYKEKVDGSKTQ